MYVDDGYKKSLIQILTHKKKYLMLWIKEAKKWNDITTVEVFSDELKEIDRILDAINSSTGRLLTSEKFAICIVLKKLEGKTVIGLELETAMSILKQMIDEKTG